MMHCTSSGLNTVPVLVSNSLASSFLNEKGRPKRRKGKYLHFFLRGINGEIDLKKDEKLVVAGYSQNIIVRDIGYLLNSTTFLRCYVVCSCRWCNFHNCKKTELLVLFN